MSNSPRLTTPPLSPSALGVRKVPENNASTSKGKEPAHDGSPSSATASDSQSFTYNTSLAPRAPSLFHSTSNFGTPTRQPVIRSDPSLLTCFDPADKELYDLWAPKK